MSTKLGAIHGDKASMAIYYDSLNGRWRHSYSERLILGDDTVLLLEYNGRQILFRVGDGVSSESPDFGVLEKNIDGWVFKRSDADVSRFNVYGLLSSKQYANGAHVSLKRNDDGVVEVQGSDFRFSYAEDLFDQVLFISGPGKDVNFSYDQTKRLISYSSVFQEQKSTRNFLYENDRVPELLTGITDERGVRYATWSYDDQGRAISSEHAGGAEKVTLAYNDDGSTTVTNALGKQTTYRFQVIQGVKRITAIEGEPSADCPAANSTYTYNDRGQVLTATDAEGRVTRYAYNDRGLEISRVEGEGTAEARTVTTEWDPEQYRRIQVTADGRRTLYSYDDQGRLLSERTEAVSAN